MMVGELCNRAVVFGRENESVRDAAKRMRDMHVGQEILTMDDALEFLDEELTEFAKLVIREQKTEMEHPHVL